MEEFKFIQKISDEKPKEPNSLPIKKTSIETELEGNKIIAQSEIKEQKRKQEKIEAISSRLVANSGEIHALRKKDREDLYLLQKEYLRNISQRVYMKIKEKGVVDTFQSDFWTDIFEAEQEVLKEEQKRKILVINAKNRSNSIRDLREGKSTEKVFNSPKPSERVLANADEMYHSFGELLVDRGENDAQEALCYDSSFRITGVVENFLFDSLVSRNLLEEADRELFLNLFTQTHYATNRSESYVQNNKKLFLQEFEAKHKKNIGKIFKFITAYGVALDGIRRLHSSIKHYGSLELARRDSVHSGVLDKSTTKAIESRNIATEVQLIKSSEQLNSSMHKYKVENLIGHSYAHGTSLGRRMSFVSEHDDEENFMKRNKIKSYW